MKKDKMKERREKINRMVGEVVYNNDNNTPRVVRDARKERTKEKKASRRTVLSKTDRVIISQLEDKYSNDIESLNNIRKLESKWKHMRKAKN